MWGSCRDRPRLGVGAPSVLDYRPGAPGPRGLRGDRWIVAAPGFAAFAAALGLTK